MEDSQESVGSDAANRGDAAADTESFESGHAFNDGYEPQSENETFSFHDQIPDVGNELFRLNVNELPPHLQKRGEDWWAIFNPRIPRELDIDLIHTFNHPSVVCCIRFNLQGSQVATGCNHAAQVFDVRSGLRLMTLEHGSRDIDGDHDMYVRSVCFSPDGKYLATGAEDKCIRLWEIANRQILKTFRGHESDIYTLDYSRDGSTIASGGADRTIRLWSVRTVRSQQELGHQDCITSVALSPKGTLVAGGSRDSNIYIWDIEKGERIEIFEGRINNSGQAGGHSDCVNSVSFSPSGRELISGSFDNTIKIWEILPIARGEGAQQRRRFRCRCVRTIAGHGNLVLSVAFSFEALYALSGSKDCGVIIWDRESGIPQLHLQGHRNSVMSVAPNPRPNGIFGTAGGDSRARIWRYV